MTARNGVDTSARVRREQAVERHERAVHLLDVEAMLRVLSGSPTFLTAVEREAVIVLADRDGIDRQVVATGLGVQRSTLGDLIEVRRRRLPRITRDLWAAVMLRPARDLVDAVTVEDPAAVAGVLVGPDVQHLAALCVVLASMVADAERDGRDPVAA